MDELIKKLDHPITTAIETLPRDGVVTFHKEFLLDHMTPQPADVFTFDIDSFTEVSQRLKDNGVLEYVWKTPEGHTAKGYYRDGVLCKARENLGNGENRTLYYDDNGTPYMSSVTKLDKATASITEVKLAPDTAISKGNFTAVTDHFGRPVLNKVTDLSVKPNGAGRDKIDVPRDDYPDGYDRGHIIADSFGGPGTGENIVPQLEHVNESDMKAVENVIARLKAEGHTVDYEVKVNYQDAENKVPSSFEPKITVDGEEYVSSDIPTKIYNSENNSALSHTVANLREQFYMPHNIAMKSAEMAAGITAVVSTVENVSDFIDGKITVEEMILDTVEDTLFAGALGYGTAFVSAAVSQAMQSSSTALISQIGGSCLPAAAVSFVVQAAGDVVSYATGEISGCELANKLGEKAVSVAGGIEGAKIGGAAGVAIGSIVGPAGTVVGGVAGAVVGGMVGCVVATEAYETAIELGSEAVEVLADKATEYAHKTIDAVKDAPSEVISTVKDSFNNFFSKTRLPVRV